jgi:predicted mannosyl-3-phosphoglycerate phosphatase (HAD superfamily)
LDGWKKIFREMFADIDNLFALIPVSTDMTAGWEVMNKAYESGQIIINKNSPSYTEFIKYLEK